ncbi:hypothetical protein [Cryptosporangium aurantiacum]|uniref:HEAT repeat n=1 Tax=Cryptosporangium aurantiacum TaxID=134849 RepID=A0A1M7KZM6_9ACTN|nr:hypothetical protein [Cryptosporangium aurantiacum]SHM71036.1 hypothetical protein SAMN05443668_1011309 [Cryptosporangium aurantiacum]
MLSIVIAVLKGLDAVAWDALSHAYGSAEDVPGMLRRAAAADAEEAAAAVEELNGSVFHQGSVYSATVAAVPFLVRLAGEALHDRAGLLWMVGMLADDRHAYGSEFVRVRDAVSAQRAALVSLLADSDPTVREAAAYAAAKSGADADVLFPRWTAEAHPSVRASLALALGEAGLAMAEPAARGEPAVRVAAALALMRSGAESLPSIDALVTAVEVGASVHYCWAGDGDWLSEVVGALPTPAVVDVLGRLLRSDEPKARNVALWTLNERCDAQRSAPAALVPLLAPLVRDTASTTREQAVGALRRAGAAAGMFADDLAAAAAGYPDTHAASSAVLTLQRLGDPRWVAPVCAALQRDHRPRFLPRLIVRCTPEVRASVQDQLAKHPVTANGLAAAIALWSTEAEPLVPELVAALPQAGLPVADALLTLGHDEVAVAVPHWRELAAEKADLRAAIAVYRLTGDAGALHAALRARLVPGVSAARRPVPSFDGLGDALTPLLPAASVHLTGEAARTYPQRELQMLAARVVAAVSGPEDVLPTVEAVLIAGDTPAREAADLIGEWSTPDRRGRLEPLLRDRLSDRWSRLAAARALARFGVPTAELAGPLAQGVTDYAGRYALDMIVELRAVETIPALERLLRGEERVALAGDADDVVWADELFRERVQKAIDELTT